MQQTLPLAQISKVVERLIDSVKDLEAVVWDMDDMNEHEFKLLAIEAELWNLEQIFKEINDES